MEMEKGLTRLENIMDSKKDDKHHHTVSGFILVLFVVQYDLSLSSTFCWIAFFLFALFFALTDNLIFLSVNFDLRMLLRFIEDLFPTRLMLDVISFDLDVGEG